MTFGKAHGLNTGVGKQGNSSASVNQSYSIPVNPNKTILKADPSCAQSQSAGAFTGRGRLEMIFYCQNKQKTLMSKSGTELPQSKKRQASSGPAPMHKKDFASMVARASLNSVSRHQPENDRSQKGMPPNQVNHQLTDSNAGREVGEFTEHELEIANAMVTVWAGRGVRKPGKNLEKLHYLQNKRNEQLNAKVDDSGIDNRKPAAHEQQVVIDLLDDESSVEDRKPAARVQSNLPEFSDDESSVEYLKTASKNQQDVIDLLDDESSVEDRKPAARAQPGLREFSDHDSSVDDAKPASREQQKVVGPLDVDSSENRRPGGPQPGDICFVGDKMYILEDDMNLRNFFDEDDVVGFKDIK